ncbi:MAG: HAMP domain-containing histidine kinase [Campylobacteraceae bacterium]|jgi:signal transduction histidine kinase|nr:HAMP domain-containing histidine kinase [Campylobacteraceae bacterium]
MQELEKISDVELLGEIQRRFDEKNRTLNETEFLNKKLIELNKRLMEADSVKSQFLSLIKNEFNNPISSVLNICSHLVSGKKPEKAHELIEMLHMEVLRLDFQIKNIIAASEIEAGKSENYYMKVDFASIMDDVRSSFYYLIKDKNLNLEFTDETKGDIYTDAGKIYLILLNLVSNACEYTFENGNIWVAVRNDDKNLYIDVKDDGEGIEVENKLLVYNRFTQFSKGATRAKTGLGLGLSVVKGVVEALGGEVDYESKKGKTEFSITIPLPSEDLVRSGSGGSNDILFEDFDDAVEM